MADQEQQTDAQAARRAAVEQAISTLTYLVVMFGVSYLVLKREVVVRQWRAWRTPRVTPAEARARRLTAELRRDIAAWEHSGGRGWSRPPRGLYERGPA